MSETLKDEVFQTLLEFGFEKSKIEKGWKNSNIKTVEGIIDYIESHPENDQTDTSPSNANQNAHFQQNISHLVKKDIVIELQTRGFSKIVSEKSLLLSGNKDLEGALNWISENKSKSDFEDPIQVEIQPNKPTISPEEAAIKALEMQKKIRDEIAEKEKQNLLEAEKLRLKSGKEMTETRRVLEEQRTKIEMDEFIREKQKTEREKQEMLRIIEEDKLRRFGKVVAPVEKQKSLKEKFDELFQKQYKVHRLGAMDVLKTCLNTIRVYIENIFKNPNEEKFRKINSTNQNFCTRVKDVPGGSAMLNLAGFVEENGFFVMKNVDLNQIQEIIGYIENELLKMS